MNYWIISDTHFGHESIVAKGHMPAGFERKLLRNISGCVESDDILIHLGDVAMKNQDYWAAELRRQCRGKLWLIRGNHDKPAGWYLTRGFDFVADSMMMERQGLTVLFTHIPHADDGRFSLNIHGHLHTGEHHLYEALPSGRNYVCVCMEHNYTPISLDFILRRATR